MVIYPQSSLIIQDCFGYLGLFVFPYEVENYSFKFCEKLSWNIDGDSLESEYCFGKISIFTM